VIGGQGARDYEQARNARGSACVCSVVRDAVAGVPRTPAASIKVGDVDARVSSVITVEWTCPVHGRRCEVRK